MVATESQRPQFVKKALRYPCGHFGAMQYDVDYDADKCPVCTQLQQERERVKKLEAALIQIRKHEIGTFYGKPVSPIGVGQTYSCSCCKDKAYIAKVVLAELDTERGNDG